MKNVLLSIFLMVGSHLSAQSIQEITMKDALNGKFHIGTAMNLRQISGDDVADVNLIKQNFDAIVAENCMKSMYLQPKEGEFYFDDADRFVAFGEKNNMWITGHCLIWHGQLPRWFFVDEKGETVSAETLKARMKSHISTVVGRYKGRIKGWDVVNEAIMEDGSYRKSKFYEILGEEFIPLAFQYAHEADPQAELYYNDYNEWYPGKRATIIKMVKSFKERGIRIDAIGMQGHVGMDSPSLAEYEEAIRDYTQAGVRVMITEFDLSILPAPRRGIGADLSANFEYKKEINPYTEGVPDSASVAWNNRMEEYFRLFLTYPGKVSRVTMWGVSDGGSWKNDFPVRGRTDYPLLFDRQHKAKPVVGKIIEAAFGQHLVLNELEYFDTQGVNVLVYSNLFTGGFNDEKTAGIELIHHGVRTAQGGAVRLSATPEQWDLVPVIPDRKINRETNSIESTLQYPDYDFESRVVATAKGKGVEISVYLDKPVPQFLEGKAGFNIEFLPSQYWGKTYLMDGRPNLFPRYAVGNSVTKPNSEKIKQFNGYVTQDDRGTGRFIEPQPIDAGHAIVLGSNDPERLVKITSDEELALYDGRVLAQNGWYIVRSLLPAGKTGKVLTWTIEPNAIPGWKREPNIGFSQIGYVPEQQKVAVIELDKQDKPLAKASLYKMDESGQPVEAFNGAIENWGDYYKYHYVKFDFSPVKTPGVYYIQYGDTKTNTFIIADNVFDKMTDATSDIWIPIHMNHMFVNEAYRVWHGEPFKEGYLQAPLNTDHFDLHGQGATTETKYKPLETIPGLNIGGWFDAGDFDIETGANIGVLNNLSIIWDMYKPQRDQTFISKEQRYVDLHRPDGVPDILQQIEHGALQLVAQAEILGHMAQTLSNGVLDNYHHIGDAASATDGLPYNPDLGPYEVAKDGKSSGRFDDLWAFTNRNASLDLRAVTAFAAASRALKGYNDELSERALNEAKRLFKEATELLAKQPRRDSGRYGSGMAEMAPNFQLFVTTGEQPYADRFQELLWPALERNAGANLLTALQAVPYMDEAFKNKLRPYVVQYKAYVDSLTLENPYGVPIRPGNWAGNSVGFGITNAFANKYYADIISINDVCKAVDYLFGCHQYHNYSLVAAVGAARPKAVFYGNNRADFSFIPGNVAPGILFRQPDHFENYDDWPFLWGQNEGTIGGNTSYLIFGTVFKNLLNRK